jgi:hypothetical protein
VSGEARPHGLPGPLPEGERLLWQGSPQWRALAWRVFHIREVAAYFAIFAAWRASAGWVETGSAAVAAERASMVLPFALGGIALLALLAYLTARYAVYTLTDRRVVLSVGVALSATVNLPLKAIESADLKVNGDGTGDLSLGLGAGPRLAYGTLWPHARPWRVKRPEPTLRAIAEPERVAGLLAEALAPGGANRVAQMRAVEADGGRAPTPALAS